MKIQPIDQQSQSFSDDQELAKVLAGVNQSADDGQEPSANSDDQQLPTPPTPMPDAALPVTDDADAPVVPSTPMPEAPAPAPTGNADPALDNIKQEALGELRPLVDKLNVSPEEKFDTYLLLLRSTDDKELIAPAHQAAKEIADESRKAQALLDIIKEIDFLSQSQQS